MDNFPCGLVQAPSSFRSSVDALLLAAFARHCLPASLHGTAVRFVELGAGCGMAACALALALPHATGMGVDVDAAAVAAARSNAQRVLLAERLSFVHCAVENQGLVREHCGSAVDLVLANPPYHAAGAGRAPRQEGRKKALHAHAGTLPIFFAAAFALLRHHGHFFCIHSPARLSELLGQLRAHRLGLRRLLPVHTRPGREAHWVLVEARRDAAEDSVLEAGLTLYATEDGADFSASALRFCPWLAKKEQQGGG